MVAIAYQKVLMWDRSCRSWQNPKAWNHMASIALWPCGAIAGGVLSRCCRVICYPSLGPTPNKLETLLLPLFFALSVRFLRTEKKTATKEKARWWLCLKRFDRDLVGFYQNIWSMGAQKSTHVLLALKNDIDSNIFECSENVPKSFEVLLREVSFRRYMTKKQVAGYCGPVTRADDGDCRWFRWCSSA